MCIHGPFSTAPSYHTDTCTHNLHQCVFSGHLTLSAISDLRGGILWLIALTRGSVCTAACRGSWLEAGTGSNWCGKKRESERKKKEREREGEKRRGGCGEKVWEIWVKRTVSGRAGWDVVWAGVGVGGDHPHHMFHGVPQCGWLWAKRTQHTQPHALPDALIFTALPPLTRKLQLWIFN